MNKDTEFGGKTLDEAIEAACAYFGVEREKLEIEIVNDAQGGIFGLMGAKKAKIRAAKLRIPSLDLLETEAPAPAPTEAPAPKGESPAAPAPKPAREGKAAGDEAPAAPAEKNGARVERKAEPAPRKPREPKAPRRTEEPAPAGQEARPAREDDPSLVDHRDDLPELNLASVPPEQLEEAVRGVVSGLVRPIVGDVPVKVEIGNGRVNVALDCGDASGLLVGRDGQTLAAVQYLASRMTAKLLGGGFRLLIDAGNYRERQEDKLREIAHELAERACKTGRSQSTRPLSAYQRRIIHLSLESHQGVITSSKGDGLQRRVVVQPRRLRPDERPEVDAPCDAAPQTGVDEASEQ